MKPAHLLTRAPYTYKASYADACTRATEAEHAADAAAAEKAQQPAPVAATPAAAPFGDI